MYGIYCTESRGHKAARGLRSINAMHPKCALYTILFPVGTATLRKLEFLKRKTQRQVYLTRNGLTKPLFESTSSRTSIQPRVEIVSDGCGLSILAWSLDHVSYCVICYKHCCCRRACMDPVYDHNIIPTQGVQGWYSHITALSPLWYWFHGIAIFVCTQCRLRARGSILRVVRP